MGLTNYTVVNHLVTVSVANKHKGNTPIALADSDLQRVLEDPGAPLPSRLPSGSEKKGRAYAWAADSQVSDAHLQYLVLTDRGPALLHIRVHFNFASGRHTVTCEQQGTGAGVVKCDTSLDTKDSTANLTITFRD